MPPQSTALSTRQSNHNVNKITKKKFNELKKQSRTSTIAKLISDDKIRKVAMKNFQHFVNANMLPVQMPEEASLKVSNNNNYRTVAINMPNFRAKYEYLGNNTEGYRAVYNDDNQYIEENRMFMLQCFPPEACTTGMAEDDGERRGDGGGWEDASIPRVTVVGDEDDDNIYNEEEEQAEEGVDYEQDEEDGEEDEEETEAGGEEYYEEEEEDE